MACSSRCFSITKNSTIFASSSPLPNNNSNSNINNTKSSSLRNPQISSKPREVSKIRKKHHPSVAEVERAIGAGIFRDRDPRQGIGENPTLFDKILMNPLDKEEGPVEKKLRETGEWIVDTTDGPSRTGGRQVLLVLCLWILPVWLLFLAVASGVIKLPFSVPYLDDMIM